MKLTVPSLLLFSSICFQAAVAQSPNANTYHMQNEWPLGGDGGWDYLQVDAPAHVLYIARNNRVMVVDTSTGKLKTEITGLGGTHGIALNTNGKTGYISDGAANMVRVFDRSSYKVTASIPAGTNPDAILFEPGTKSVYAFNGRSNNATVIDANTNKVVETITLPGKPEFAQADSHGHVFVNLEDTSQLVRIDTASHKVTATWPLAPCDAPSGLAIDRAHDRLFAACDNEKMAVVDSESGKVVATPAIGKGPDAASFDGKHQLAFSSNGESGTLTVVQEQGEAKYAVVQTLPTMQSARTMTVDPTTGTIYSVAAKFGPRPAATAAAPHPRPAVLPNSFVVLVLSR